MPDDREIYLKTPLGADVLMFARMEGEDRISQCFDFTLEAVSEDGDLDAADILGETVTVKVGEDVRFFHAHVTQFGFKEFRGGYAYYTLRLQPWLWFLSNRVNCKIFQNMSVVEIIEEVFGDYPNAKFEKRLQGSYEPREYCVQYDETDLNFIQRLMEHEGIFYFFEYADGEHTMVLSDANSELKPNDDFKTIPYHSDGAPPRDVHDYITAWTPRSAVMSGAYTHTDFDFTKPSADLMAKSEQPLGHSQDDAEVYAHPGSHLTLDRGDAIALIRREELQARSKRADAAGSVRGLWSGCTFKLSEFPREVENDEYLVVSQHYRMWDPQYRTGIEADTAAVGFEVMLRVAPTAVPFRPWRRTPAPVMRGPQTATVVGPAGEEIFTDEYSRVKVQFHWDRLGARDENSSCFVRVSSVWAGSGWGFIQIPRIGQEVIVDFIEGDPDKPMITGRVYNAENMPPYGLPGNATQSGWKSNSSPGGGGWNELRFEDKKGAEEVYFQAEKDHNELVKNDESRLIQHDMSERVDNDSSQSIGHDRTELVENDKRTQVDNNRNVIIGNNDTENVGVDRSLTVGQNEEINIGSNSAEEIGMNHSQTVGLLQKILVKAGRSKKIGVFESNAIGASQTTTVGLKRNVRVGSKQAHHVQSDDSWTIKGNQAVTISKNQEMKVTGDQSFWVDGDGTYMVTKKAFHSSEDDATFRSNKKVLIEANDSITLKCGDATMELKKDGTVTVNGKDMTFKGSGKINVKADSDLNLKGSKINEN